MFNIQCERSDLIPIMAFIANVVCRFPLHFATITFASRDAQDLKTVQHQRGLTVQNIQQNKDEDNDEYEWVTDTDEEYPEYQCDVCGRVMSADCERFHCQICEDYDLVSSQKAFQRKTKGCVMCLP